MLKSLLAVPVSAEMAILPQVSVGAVVSRVYACDVAVTFYFPASSTILNLIVLEPDSVADVLMEVEEKLTAE